MLNLKSKKNYIMFPAAAHLIAVIFLLITGEFIWKGSSAVLFADDWYYLQKVIYPIFSHHFTWQDLFVKRGPDDNAQPINRLILIANTFLSNMDYAYQGIFGAIIALACVYLLFWIVRKDERNDIVFRKHNSYILLIAMSALLLSLNATNIFTWPLVTTLVFTGLFGITIFFYAQHRLTKHPNIYFIIIYAFLISTLTLVLLDTFATIAIFGVAIILALEAIKSHKRQPLLQAGGTLTALWVYGLAYNKVFQVASQPLGEQKLAQAFDFYGKNIKDIWKVVVVPFSTPYYYPNLFDERSWIILLIIFFIAVLLNISFWLDFMARKCTSSFVAACLMLYSYGTIAGILIGRVPRFGIDYIQQPRYVAFYTLQILAILMMLSLNKEDDNQLMRKRKYSFLGLSAIVTVLYFPYAYLAWQIIPYTHDYQQHEIQEIVQIYNNPTKVPEKCDSNSIVICRWPVIDRAQLTGLLHQRKLNLFSTKFRAQHKFVL